MTPTEFRETLPEFRSPEDYPEAQVNFYLKIAAQLVNAKRLRDLTNYAIALATAHYLVGARANQTAVAQSQVPGAVATPISSESVDKVRISYDTSMLSKTNSSFWSTSNYGVQLLSLLRLAGAGGYVL